MSKQFLTQEEFQASLDWLKQSGVLDFLEPKQSQKQAPSQREQRLEQTFASCYPTLEEVPGWNTPDAFNLIFMNRFPRHEYTEDTIAKIKKSLRFDGWFVVLTESYKAFKDFPESKPFYYIETHISSPPLKETNNFYPSTHIIACWPRSHQSIIHGIKTANYVSAQPSAFFGERNVEEDYSYDLYEYLIESLTEPRQSVLFTDPSSIIGPLAASRSNRVPFSVLSPERKQFSRENLLNY